MKVDLNVRREIFMSRVIEFQNWKNSEKDLNPFQRLSTLDSFKKEQSSSKSSTKQNIFNLLETNFSEIEDPKNIFLKNMSCFDSPKNSLVFRPEGVYENQMTSVPKSAWSSVSRIKALTNKPRMMNTDKPKPCLNLGFQEITTYESRESSNISQFTEMTTVQPRCNIFI